MSFIQYDSVKQYCNCIPNDRTFTQFSCDIELNPFHLLGDALWAQRLCTELLPAGAPLIHKAMDALPFCMAALDSSLPQRVHLQIILLLQFLYTLKMRGKNSLASLTSWSANISSIGT